MKTTLMLLMSLTLWGWFTQRGLADDILIFTADWCGPCQQLKQDLQDNQDALVGYTWGYVDVDSEPELKAQYGVTNVPAVVVVDTNNKEIKRQVGYTGLDKLKKWLASNDSKARLFTRWRSKNR